MSEVCALPITFGMERDHPHEHANGYQDGSQWAGFTNYTSPHQQSPAHDYGGFTFSSPPVTHEQQLAGAYNAPRTTHPNPQLHSLIMPTWPSMLTSNSSYLQPIMPATPAPTLPTPNLTSLSSVSASAGPPLRSSHGGSTPRKTLTDADRRRMCQYHEENPTTKQTEIGALFGVERSTVSKVLRNKEKYLFQDDGSRSPIKRSKGKFPDIERALSSWARNHQRQGMPLSDEIIRERAHHFATAVGNSESHAKVNSNSWLEKFKQKNHLMGAKPRKRSAAPEESEGASIPTSNSHTPGGISPTSPDPVGSPSPLEMSGTRPDEGPKSKPPSDFCLNRNRPLHSQSNTSLSSVFSEQGPSTFTGAPASPTSPFFTPDQDFGGGSFVAGGQQNAGGSGYQRPRSQTFPMIGVDPYISPPASGEPLTPKYVNTTALDSPLSELQTQVPGLNSDTMPPPQQATAAPHSSPAMPPPPLPGQSNSTTGTTHPRIETSPPATVGSPNSPPSQEDARRALELVMDFFQSQPRGFMEPQEYFTIGKLMEKLRLQRSPSGATDATRSGAPLHGVVERGFLTGNPDA